MSLAIKRCPHSARANVQRKSRFLKLQVSFICFFHIGFRFWNSKCRCYWNLGQHIMHSENECGCGHLFHVPKCCQQALLWWKGSRYFHELAYLRKHCKSTMIIIAHLSAYKSTAQETAIDGGLFLWTQWSCMIFTKDKKRKYIKDTC